MRKLTVGQIQFFVGESEISYLQTRGSRIYQAVVGLGFAVVFVAVGVMVARQRPLVGLIGEGDTWNTIAAFLSFCFAASIIGIIPIYLRRSSVRFVINSNRPLVRRGKRVLKDIRTTQSIGVQRAEATGESPPAWFVVARLETGEYRLPELNFDSELDVKRASSEIASFLSVPNT